MNVRLTSLALLMLSACSEKPSEPREAEASPISQIVMHRSGCYGPCPIYTVTINSDGNVTFEGQEYVAAKGTAKWTISADEVVFLRRSIERVGFFGLNESDPSAKDGCPTDNPTVDIVVSRGETKKHVSHYYGCKGIQGDRIDWLSKTIDDVAGTHRSVLEENPR